MANGVLVSNTTAGGKTTWVWRETDPMAPYLATATLGRFDLTDLDDVGGIPSYVAVDPQLSKGQVLRKLPASVDFYTSIYGPYPFDAVGAIVDDAKVVGYSLETQTKPVFDRMPDEATLVARALAHVVRRLGDADDVAGHLAARGLRDLVGVDLERAPGQQVGGAVVQPALQHAARRTPRSGRRPPAIPGTPAFLFNGTIYYRGAMTLEALREKIGDATFFRMLRDWAQQQPLRQRHDGAVHRAGRAGERHGPRALLRRLALPARQADLLVAAGQ